MLSAVEGPTTIYRVSVSGKSSININSELITEILLTQGFPSWHFFEWSAWPLLQGWLHMEVRAAHWGSSFLSRGYSCPFPSRNLQWWVPTSFWEWRKQRQTHAGRSSARRALSTQGLFCFPTPYPDSCSEKSNARLPKGGRRELC